MLRSSFSARSAAAKCVHSRGYYLAMPTGPLIPGVFDLKFEVAFTSYEAALSWS